MPLSPDPSALLEHSAWIQALARRLVRDPARAEDVAQATFLAALERPPRETTEPRRWLATVARNAARQLGRSEGRRRTREAHAARSEALPSVQELSSRAELQGHLVGHVLALGEERREVVLLRYFEGLEPTEIARRTGVPAATVRTRLHRALAELRERLDRAEGGRQHWLAALAPLAEGKLAHVSTSKVALPLLTGLLAMKKLTLLSLGLVLVAGTWLTVDGLEPTAPPQAIESLAAGGRPDARQARQGVEVRGTERIASSAPVEEAAEGAAAVSMRNLRLVVHALDTGLPVEGAQVRLSRDGVSRRLDLDPTDRAGASNLPSDLAPEDQLEVEHPAYERATRMSSELPGVGTYELVLHPIGTLEVLVLGENDTPLPDRGVRVEAVLDRGGTGIAHSYPVVRTGPDGRAIFQGVATGRSLTAWISGQRASTTRTVLDPVRRRGELIVRFVDRASLRGTVLEPDGSPAVGVEVAWWGPATTGDFMGAPTRTSDADGAFSFPDLAPGPGRVEVRRGTAPRVEVERPPGETELAPIRLPHAVTVSGVVLLPEGRSATGLELRLFRDGYQQVVVVVEEGGRFELEVAPGPAELLLTRGGWWEEGIDQPEAILVRDRIVAPAHDLVLAPPPGGALEGETLTSTTGVIVTLYRAGRFDQASRPQSWSHEFELSVEDSIFRAVDVPSGRYDVQLRGDGAVRWWRDIEIRADGVTPLADTVGGTGSLHLLIADAEGVPVPHGKLDLLDLEGDSTSHTADEQGRVQLDDLGPGPWAVRVRIDGAARLPGENLWLRAGEILEHTLVVEPSARLLGEVLDADGPVVAGEVKMQHSDANRYWTMTTDEQGRFEAPGRVPPGPYRLWIRGGVLRHIELAPGEEAFERFVLSERDLQLELFSRGQPLRHLTSAIGLGLFGEERGRSQRSSAHGHRVALIAGDSRSLLVLDFEGPYTARVLVTVLPPLEPGQHVHELGGTDLIIAATANVKHGPPVRAFLHGFEEEDLRGRSFFASTHELLFERDDSGRQVFPHVPAGAVLELVGHDADGARIRREVRVGNDTRTTIAWP